MRPDFFFSPEMQAAEPVDEAATWRLTDLYPDVDSWESARLACAGAIDSLDTRKGQLGQGPQVLVEVLRDYFGAVRRLRQVHSYAANGSAGDTRDGDARGRKQQASMMFTQLRSKTAWLEPELLGLESRVRVWMSAEPTLAPYSVHLDDVLRKAPHTLGSEGEAVLAAAGDVVSGPESVFTVLTSAELPFRSATLSDGTELKVDHATYFRQRASANRVDREAVVKAFYGSWSDYQGTLGATLNAGVQGNWFRARSRTYGSSLEAALDGDNIPTSVYRTLIAETQANLPTLHRYLRLRARMLKLDPLEYHDLYPPLVELDRSYPLAVGRELALDSAAPLGPEYVAGMKAGLDGRWMDAYPRTGKTPGAYMSDAAYDVHPFVLMNYVDNWNSVSTLCHEWGHAMHSVLANSHQPFETARYSIFVAEVASTFNEMLLLDHALEGAKDKQERLYFLGHALEDLRTTYFRQAMFAEFELELHDAVEKGEPLTGDSISARYLALLRRHHGHDEGVMVIGEHCATEWCFVPHFYYDFYVYQYATSLAAAAQFAGEVLDGDEDARSRYLSVLKAGGSRYAYELLAGAGVDLASPAPYRALAARMEAIMDEMEGLLE